MLDLRKRLLRLWFDVKCPICNETVPFSLQMHMHMVHGPGGKPLPTPFEDIKPAPTGRKGARGGKQYGGKQHGGKRGAKRRR
ncbi:MAG: hypothetical protein JWM16_2597 [Verrucomicrobiales bacterium]|nr:hypothetical protein [Verrucomicrobiales bacterium]